MYTLQSNSPGTSFCQRTECCPTGVLPMSDGTLEGPADIVLLFGCIVNKLVTLERTATISKDIDLEGEFVKKELTCFVVKLAADPEAANIVDIIDEPVDIIACLLRDAEQVCL